MPLGYSDLVQVVTNDLQQSLRQTRGYNTTDSIQAHQKIELLILLYELAFSFPSHAAQE